MTPPPDIQNYDFDPMTFTMDTPMAFPIPWVLPYDSATEDTMGFDMYTPMGFPMSFAIISKQLWYHVFSHATLQ